MQIYFYSNQSPPTRIELLNLNFPGAHSWACLQRDHVDNEALHMLGCIHTKHLDLSPRADIQPNA